MLGQGGTLDGPVQEAGDDGAPEEDGEGKGAQDGAYCDEDGAVGEGRVVHEGRIAGWRDGRRRVRGDFGVDRLGKGREVGWANNGRSAGAQAREWGGAG